MIGMDRFYVSTETWHHGLFYFRAGFPEEEKALVTGVIYALWTMHGDSLFLLTGSPKHIMGDKVVREGVFIPGSSGAVDQVFQITLGEDWPGNSGISA
jgi:hypothetical protein